jgi:hypothetical protein
MEESTRLWKKSRGDENTSFVSLHVLNPSDHSQWGCDGHPSVKGDKMMADVLTKHIEGILAVN